MISKRHLVLAVIMLGISLVAAACIETSSEPEIVATRLAVSPEPVIPPPEFDLTAGSAIYAESCAPCHGETGLGDGVTAAAFTCEVPAFANMPTDVDLTEWHNIATNGRVTSDTCIMPPWNQRLNSTQIWNAVAYAASLRHTDAQRTRGEAILADYQTEDAEEIFQDTAWQVENTDADILAALRNNTLPGYNFTEPLSPDDQEAVLAYIRSRAYGEMEVAEAPLATEVVSPPATEDAESPATAEGTPPPSDEEAASPTAIENAEQPAATEDAEQPAPTPTLESYSVVGTVVNGTEGGSVPDGLVLTLRVAGLDENNNPIDLYTAETTLAEDKTFVFNDVPRDLRSIGLIQTDYAGVRQLSPQILPDPAASGPVEITFTIYEVTSEPVDIALQYVEHLVDAVTVEEASLTFQSLQFVNNSDRIYVGGEDGRTLTIPLPGGASNPQINALGSPEDRFILEQEGDQYIFYDTAPLFPGLADIISARFNMRYNGSMQVEQNFPYRVVEWNVFVSESRGLQLESRQLTPVQGGTLNNVTYDGYGLTNLPAGTTLSYRVFDGETASAGGTSFLQENTTLILGIGVLLLVAGGMFLFYDLQKSRLQVQGQGAAPAAPTNPAPTTKEELIAAIAALDDAYEAGEIDETSYQQERNALKAELRTFFE